MIIILTQVGKSTLIKCMVKHYTKQNLAEVKGPITVVAGGLRMCVCAVHCTASVLSCMFVNNEEVQH